MAETYETLEEATRALTATAQRAATLMREESDKARHEAGRARQDAERAWGEIESVRGEILATRAELDGIRDAMLGSHDETRRLRMATKMAWGTVAVMAVLVMVSVGWTASVLTRSNAQISHMNTRMAELITLADARATELDQLRADMQSARIAQARAEGELRAVSYARVISEPTLKPIDLQLNSAPIQLPSFREMIHKLMGDLKFGGRDDAPAAPSFSFDFPIIPEPSSETEESGLQVTELPTR